MIKSKHQTKQWRQNQTWYINGKKNECEKNQIEMLNKIILLKLCRTDDRINMYKLIIQNNRYPYLNPDGFEWTENFDIKLIIKQNIIYFNLKFICDFGGMQTRSLNMVYHFINIQKQYLENSNNSNNSKCLNVYFINILDGNGCYKFKQHFNYLKNKIPIEIKNNIFIGDMYKFNKYWNQIKILL